MMVSWHSFQPVSLGHQCCSWTTFRNVLQLTTPKIKITTPDRRFLKCNWFNTYNPAWQVNLFSYLGAHFAISSFLWVHGDALCLGTDALLQGGPAFLQHQEHLGQRFKDRTMWTMLCSTGLCGFIHWSFICGDEGTLWLHSSVLHL